MPMIDTAELLRNALLDLDGLNELDTFLVEHPDDPAVGFLVLGLLDGLTARLNADPHDVDDRAWYPLGSLEDAVPENAAARAALGTRKEALLGLLDAGHERIRRGAAVVLGHLGPDEYLAATLWARVGAEPDPTTRADLLRAASRTHPATAERELPARLGPDRTLQDRAAAVCALIDLGSPLVGGPATEDALVAAWLPDGDPLADSAWPDSGLRHVLPAVPSAVPRLLAGGADTRLAVVRAIGSEVSRSRSALDRHVRHLAGLLTDPDEDVRALATAAVAGSVRTAPAYLDALYATLNNTPRSRPIVLFALVHAGDPRASETVLRAWRDGWAPRELSRWLTDAGVPASPELIGAARGRHETLAGAAPGRNGTLTGPQTIERNAIDALLHRWEYHPAAPVEPSPLELDVSPEELAERLVDIVATGSRTWPRAIAALESLDLTAVAPRLRDLAERDTRVVPRDRQADDRLQEAVRRLSEGADRSH
ncbi:hypothetical protein [Longispora urticae]